MVSKLCATVANAAPMGRRKPARIVDFMDDREDVGKPGGIQTQNPMDLLARIDAFSATQWGLNNAAEEAIILGALNGSDPS